MPWVVDLDALRSEVPIPRAYLLNDLEALAWSVPVLTPDEIEVLHEGQADPAGNVALIAAGTGLGIALLPRVDGRLVPRASEGGHVDFAPRNADEQALAARVDRRSTGASTSSASSRDRASRTSTGCCIRINAPR